MINRDVDKSAKGLLNGKAALILGASRGIGEAIARLFAAEGAKVALAARSEDAIARIAAEIRTNDGEAIAIRTDIADPASIEIAVRRTVEAFGRLDIAVNNAGIAGGNKPLIEVTEELFDCVITTNLKGTFMAMKYEIAAMLSSGSGVVLNMSSTVGLVGSGAGIAPYVASKHGIVGLTRAAALEYAKQNIRVNAIAPGTTRTPINERWLDDEQIRQRLTGVIPLGRVGEPRDVAEAALWLCSDAASYLTGVTLPVDGGAIVP